MDVMSILQWEDQIAVRNMCLALTVQRRYLVLFLVTCTFLAVGLYLMSCALVRDEMDFDNSKNSSEGCALNSSKSSKGSCPYFLVLM